ncbi:hypothetical protein P691DRAFT_673926 [Macrolepiota fuliginosa MF-IS2]|uniref:Endonuclease/exonuclease/phosphatase domain-containing protein n=1 Tax=Macrolepiota fuliginosa MF-IS2 TaxID=1400762 RepID=A0A9P6C076_9AGAR|nr:hypothetical protein P691DRAFT_673926 [Macrolepiota fuliginosa MF-IS2]
MQGRGANTIYDSCNKWHTINNYINHNKIGIMCLQETHLDKQQTNQINNFHHRLKVISSIDPKHPNTKGVAIVLNSCLTTTQRITARTLIPGRALLAEIPWHGTETLTILTIYAPNNTNKNCSFWVTLQEMWENNTTNLPWPDIMTGNFNLTEDPIDRSNG